MGWITQFMVEPVSLHQFINAGFSGAISTISCHRRLRPLSLG